MIYFPVFQLKDTTVDKSQYDTMRGRVHVLMTTLRAEQAVSQERAKQVDEVKVLTLLSTSFIS